MMLQSSWKISFATFSCGLSGKDWNPIQDRSLNLIIFLKNFLEHSDEVSSRRHLHLVSVLYNISPLPSCSSSEVWLL